MDVAKLKWKNRAKDSALSTIKALLPPLVNLVAAYIVIQANGQESWGAFVEVLIFVSLTSMLLSFGVKDYVLREASLKPQHLYALTKSALATRLLLLIVGIGAAFLFFNYDTAFWLAIWLTAQWIYTGIDPLINFEKKYWIGTLAEIIGGFGLVGYLFFNSAETPNLIVAFAVMALAKSVVVSVFFGRKLKQEKASIF